MIDYIRKKLDATELLCQLSEEASELAQAALKLRRAITGKNPTPVTHEQARENLLEEVADVFLCLRTLEIPLDPAAYYQTMNTKDNRWSERLSKIQEPGPLTLEELRQMHGEPVWIANIRSWGIVYVEDGGACKGRTSVKGVWGTGKFDWVVENSHLVCYRHKPKEVQE